MKAKLVLLLLALFLPVALLSFLLRDTSIDRQTGTDSMKRMFIGTVPIAVDVADTVAEQVRGLSGRERLPENTGLLFVFAEDGRHGIWMRDMRFSIDIVWAKEGGEIVHVEEKAGPDTYPQVFEPDEDARYVLELPAGFLELHGIREGDRLSLPFDL